jgi:Zn-dependent hydrolases, including glyoxylases
MILERFYDDNLAEASYLIACEKSRNAAVIDPTLDIGIYTALAERRKLNITHVLETHVHADFLSGGAALAKEAGAELCLSAEGDAMWGYDFSSARSARKLRDGDEISLGPC